eukprot:TRINITY_DN8954_c0_g1_i1.p1 TRINITY_DN8954_c0_g1~~TRINITY_DN8954_c0_g1_i1.p1  ORF type:complete len:146 (+),score=30.88 TRINITY_DN8954_c0_g1_i1:90-527(+)
MGRKRKKRQSATRASHSKRVRIEKSSSSMQSDDSSSSLSSLSSSSETIETPSTTWEIPSSIGYIGCIRLDGPKEAWQYYAEEHWANAHNPYNFGPGLVKKMLQKQYNELDEEEKQPYQNLEAKDKTRYKLEAGKLIEGALKNRNM